jgi:acetolactate decarboxylase
MKKLPCILLLSFSLFSATAQQKANNQLFTAGIASGLMGGLFDGFYPVGKLLTQGNFGLGAPDKIDGELLVFNGKAYKTDVSGKTTVLPPAHKVSFAMVNFFKPFGSLRVQQELDKDGLFRLLDSLLPQQNNMYAIHIKGRFKFIKTRAFPKVENHPYPTLSSMIPLQHFFPYNDVSGDLIGYRLPAYMDNTNIAGYHFHFLSQNQQQGGHIVELRLADVVIEYQPLHSYTVAVPDDSLFQQFNFQHNRAADIRDVERGSRQ